MLTEISCAGHHHAKHYLKANLYHERTKECVFIERAHKDARAHCQNGLRAPDSGIEEGEEDDQHAPASRSLINLRLHLFQGKEPLKYV